MNKKISKELDLLRKEYLEDSQLKSYFNINNGDCYEFSDFVYRKIGKKYGLEEVYSDDLCEVDDDGFTETSVFDEELILKYNKNELPLGLTITQLNNLELVPHCFITDDYKYYDAECIEGVDRVFDLPIYKREFYVLRKYLKDTNNLLNGIIASEEVRIIDEFKTWVAEFFKITDEFKNAEEFWVSKFPELFNSHY